MTVFEQELHKLFGNNKVFEETRIVGNTCYGMLTDNIRVKINFQTGGVADHYDRLKVTLLNRNEGPIDVYKRQDVELEIDPGKTESGMESKEEPDETERDVVIRPDTGEGTTGAETERPVYSRPAQTDQTKQSIQPEATKPAAPSEEVLKDPTQKPDGTVVDTPPEPVDHEQVETCLLYTSSLL